MQKLSSRKPFVSSFLKYFFQGGAILLMTWFALCAFFHSNWWPSRGTQNGIWQLGQAWSHAVPTLSLPHGMPLSFAPGFLTNTILLAATSLQSPSLEGLQQEAQLIATHQRLSLLIWSFFALGFYRLIHRGLAQRKLKIAIAFTGCCILFLLALTPLAGASVAKLWELPALNVLSIATLCAFTVATSSSGWSGLFLALTALETGGAFHFLAPILAGALGFSSVYIEERGLRRTPLKKLAWATLSPLLSCALFILSVQLPLLLNVRELTHSPVSLLPLVFLVLFMMVRCLITRNPQALRTFLETALTPYCLTITGLIFLSALQLKIPLKSPLDFGFLNESAAQSQRSEQTKLSALQKTSPQVFSTKTLKGRTDLNCKETDSFELRCNVYAIAPSVVEVSGLTKENQRVARVFLDGRKQESVRAPTQTLNLTPGPHDILVTHHFGLLEVIGVLCFLTSILSLFLPNFSEPNDLKARLES